MMIELDPDVAAAFRGSTAVSSKFTFFIFLIFNRLINLLAVLVAQKGISANLCKIGSKRRRTHQEILEEKAEMERKDKEIQDKLAAYHDL